MKRGLTSCFVCVWVLLGATSLLARTFKQEQLRYPRVRTAYRQKKSLVKQYFSDKGLAFPPKKILIQILKQEQQLELWALSQTDSAYHLVTSYPFSATSGVLGPKRQEGDKQIPEGFYHVEIFNPCSNFYLSLGINYPNASDRILGVKGNLGGEIFIHGSCVTIGCVPITDPCIKELYITAVEARNNGQKKIPVYIYPARLDKEGIKSLTQKYGLQPKLITFWLNLKQGYDYFTQHKKLPKIRVAKDGRYLFSD